MMFTDMNCKKTRRLVEDLAKNRLPQPLAEQVRQHLTECTDCRVAQQRMARLLRLLALKRHEQPPPEYFAGFLNEFHRRQRAQLDTGFELWKKITDSLIVEPARAVRFGFAGALGVALAAGVMWIGLSTRDRFGGSTGDRATAPKPPVTVASNSSDPSDPEADRILLTLTGSAQPPTPAGLSFALPDERAEMSEPGYVLDRIKATPVSYEVASIRF
jgi:hypothetical protein